MNIYDLIDYVAVNRNDLTEADIYNLMNSMSHRDSLELSKFVWQHNTGLAGDVVFQIQGIHHWHKEHNFITDTQHKWLVWAVIDNWKNVRFEQLCRVLSL